MRTDEPTGGTQKNTSPPTSHSGGLGGWRQEEQTPGRQGKGSGQGPSMMMSQSTIITTRMKSAKICHRTRTPQSDKGPNRTSQQTFLTWSWSSVHGEDSKVYLMFVCLVLSSFAELLVFCLLFTCSVWCVSLVECFFKLFSYWCLLVLINAECLVVLLCATGKSRKLVYLWDRWQEVCHPMSSLNH